MKVSETVTSYDSWVNEKTGLGTARDLAKEARLLRSQRSYRQYADLYEEISIAKKAINIVPRESLKGFVNFSCDTDSNFDGLFKKFCKALGIVSSVKNAWKFSRIEGGSILVANVVDGKEESEPLDLKSDYCIYGFEIYRRFEIDIRIEDRYLDLKTAKEKYKKPEFFYIKTPLKTLKVHETRVIPFEGELSTSLVYQDAFFGTSSLQTAYQDIQNYCSAISHLPDLISNLKLTVVKLNGLANTIREYINDGDKDSAKRVASSRMEEIQKNISNFSKIIVDTQDEIDFKSPPLDGINHVIPYLKEALQAALEFPHTILFNDAPSASLGSSGSGESKQWDDYIDGMREEYLRDKLDKIFSIMINASNSPFSSEPSHWSYSFKKLSVPSQAEETLNRKTQSEIDEKYFNMGAITNEEIRNSRFNKGYSYETSLLDSDLEDTEDKENV